jgi:hypothetical protein
MKKSLLVVPMVLALAACSTDPFQKRADAERERQEKQVDRSISQAPKWMMEVPKSNSAVYANGTAVSPDMGMSVSKAKTMAYGKICMAAGGQVSQQGKVYRLDSGKDSTEASELAVKSFCAGTDISGVELMETKMITEGTQFRTYVLVALPTGDANTIQKFKAEQTLRRLGETRSREAFKEIENQEAKPAQ